MINKVKSATEGILYVIGFYYRTDVPYPKVLTKPLLYIQSEVLKDELHKKEQQVLKKFLNKIKASETDVEF